MDYMYWGVFLCGCLCVWNRHSTSVNSDQLVSYGREDRGSRRATAQRLPVSTASIKLRTMELDTRCRKGAVHLLLRNLRLLTAIVYAVAPLIQHGRTCFPRRTSNEGRIHLWPKTGVINHSQQARTVQLDDSKIKAFLKEADTRLRPATCGSNVVFVLCSS